MIAFIVTKNDFDWLEWRAMDHQQQFPVANFLMDNSQCSLFVDLCTALIRKVKRLNLDCHWCKDVRVFRVVQCLQATKWDCFPQRSNESN